MKRVGVQSMKEQFTSRWSVSTAALWMGAVLALGIPAQAFAEELWNAITTPLFRNFTQDTGVPSAANLRVFEQDAAGYMWIGSESGLSRWDGYRFKTYNVDPRLPNALPSDNVRSLHTDRRGRLWIGMRVGGLARFDPSQDRFIRYGAQAGLLHATVNAIADDGRDGLWIGGDHGLNRLDVKTGKVALTAFRDVKVYALLRDSRRDLWIATGKGLFRRSESSGVFQPVALHSPAKDPVVPGSLFEDSQHRVWIGTRHDGGYVLAPGESVPVPIKETDAGPSRLSSLTVVAIGEAAPGQIWLGTETRGIVVVHGADLSTQRIQRDITVASSLSDDSISFLLRDRSGLMWVATNRGISLHDPQAAVKTAFGASARPRGLTDPDVHSVAVMPDGRVWLGLGAKGVDIIDPKRGRVGQLRPGPARPAKALPIAYVDAIALAPGGAVYLAGPGTLYRSDLSAKSVTRVALPLAGDGQIRALLVQDDNLWVAYDGLLRYRLGPQGQPIGEPQHINRGLSNPHVTALAPGADGTLWVGTDRGLNRVDRNMRVLETVLPSSDAGGLSEGDISTLLIDRLGRLWAGSQAGGGINILLGRDSQGRMRFRHLGVEDGLPNGNVDQLLVAPDGDVWASTDGGLARIDPKTFAITALRNKDGVYLGTFWTNSGAVTRDGDLVFGGVGGISIVRPDAVKPWRFQAPIVVTQAEVGGRLLTSDVAGAAVGGKPLRVDAAARSLQVEFAALDYSWPEYNLYEHKLVGYDKDWITTGADHRAAVYANLPPGSYRLRLRGSNRDGIWTEASLDIPIEVLPAWYQTLLFRIAALLAAAGGVVALVRWRTSALHRTKDELGRQVEERTAQLREQTDLALAANQAKSKFLAMMSHELRTPMNGVLGMAQAMKRSVLSHSQASQVDMILNSGKSLMSILNDILDISKIEAGKLELESATFDLLEMGRTVYDLWANVAASKGVKLSYEAEPGASLWVTGDPVRVRQILLNLVSNALKFTADGEVRMEIDQDPGGVRIRVSDTGIGISEDQQAKLFQSFTQADASTSRRFGGTGLGLSICKQLSELMGGDIALQSQEGVGSMFTVSLPLPPADAATETATDDEETSHLAGLRFLVVDDHPINLAVATAILGSVGCDVTTAGDGMEALDALRTGAFDGVLMDMQMPRMSGAEALAEIRGGRAGRPDIPVIALTADAMSGADERLMNLGFDAVQLKPIDPTLLFRAIGASVKVGAKPALKSTNGTASVGV